MLRLWRTWAVAFGSLILPLLLVTVGVPRLWIPFVCIVEVWALMTLIKSQPVDVNRTSTIVLTVASRALLLTALVMLIIVILCTDWLVPTVIYLNLYNTEIPFITSLVIFPITAITCLVWLYCGLAGNYYRNSQRRNGYYVGDNLTATLYYRETRYQMRILLVVSLVIASCEYWYYFTRYINTNVNRPDNFFFNWLPMGVYVLSLLFMGGRYSSMEQIFNSVGNTFARHRNRTVIRFLLLCGDDILLRCDADDQWDTPFVATANSGTDRGEHRARLLMEDLCGHKDFTLRYCFTNEGLAAGSTLVHYAVFIAPERREAFGAVEDNWFTPYMLDRALSSNMLSPMLANELYRIHTITLAWKTYDRRGQRLYPIRHYRPTFRFRDLPKWQVDYDDQTWFDVAHNNEDRPFFRLRRIWGRLTGILRRRQSTQS